MNQKIRDHVAKYNNSNGWGSSNDDIVFSIREGGKAIWEGHHKRRRWWVDFFRVIDIDGMKIGFWDAETTGDDSASDKGWEFDPKTICEVVEKTEIVTVTSYWPMM